MFLVNTRKRNKDKTFGHEKMPKGRYAFQVDCSTVIEGHSDYRKNADVMQDLAATLRGTSGPIPGRTGPIVRNTFRLGPEPESNSESFGEDD